MRYVRVSQNNVVSQKEDGTHPQDRHWQHELHKCPRIDEVIHRFGVVEGKTFEVNASGKLIVAQYEDGFAIRYGRKASFIEVGKNVAQNLISNATIIQCLLVIVTVAVDTFDTSRIQRMRETLPCACGG